MLLLNIEKETLITDDSTGTIPHVHKLAEEHVVGRDLRVCLCYLVHRGAAFAYRGRFSLLFLSSRWFRKRKRNKRGEAQPRGDVVGADRRAASLSSKFLHRKYF